MDPILAALLGRAANIAMRELIEYLDGDVSDAEALAKLEKRWDTNAASLTEAYERRKARRAIADV